MSGDVRYGPALRLYLRSKMKRFFSQWMRWMRHVSSFLRLPVGARAARKGSVWLLGGEHGTERLAGAGRVSFPHANRLALADTEGAGRGSCPHVAPRGERGAGTMMGVGLRGA